MSKSLESYPRGKILWSLRCELYYEYWSQGALDDSNTACGHGDIDDLRRQSSSVCIFRSAGEHRVRGRDGPATGTNDSAIGISVHSRRTLLVMLMLLSSLATLPSRLQPLRPPSIGPSIILSDSITRYGTGPRLTPRMLQFLTNGSVNMTLLNCTNLSNGWCLSLNPCAEQCLMDRCPSR